jgi:hypothetical protein
MGGLAQEKNVEFFKYFLKGRKAIWEKIEVKW